MPIHLKTPCNSPEPCIAPSPASQPDGIATVCGDRHRTFAPFRDRIARLAAAFRTLGVGSGDRVGILALNSDWVRAGHPHGRAQARAG